MSRSNSLILRLFPRCTLLNFARELIHPRVKLQAFEKFKDTTQALDAAANILEASLGKDLKKFLKKNIVEADSKEVLAVADGKLGGLINKKLSIQCISNDIVMEVFRGIRAQLSSLLKDMPEKEYKAMSLGLSHSLCRYKLKFSPDKVDTMIIQAIGIFVVIKSF